MDIPLSTCGKFPHYTFYPLFHSTFPQFPFRTLPSAFYQQRPRNDFGHDDSIINIVVVIIIITIHDKENAWQPKYSNRPNTNCKLSVFPILHYYLSARFHCLQ